MNWLELMRVFGGRAQLLDAPAVEVHRALLVLLGTAEAERESADDLDHQAKQIESQSRSASGHRY